MQVIFEGRPSREQLHKSMRRVLGWPNSEFQEGAKEGDTASPSAPEQVETVKSAVPTTGKLEKIK